MFCDFCTSMILEARTRSAAVRFLFEPQLRSMTGRCARDRASCYQHVVFCVPTIRRFVSLHNQSTCLCVCVVWVSGNVLYVRAFVCIRLRYAPEFDWPEPVRHSCLSRFPVVWFPCLPASVCDLISVSPRSRAGPLQRGKPI